MARTKQTSQKSTKVQELEKQLKDERARERRQVKVENAKKTLADLESEFGENLDTLYERSKRIFFQVNGARRTLKNSD